MKTRKQFLLESAAIAIGAIAFPKSALPYGKKEERIFGLQLFTLFNVIDADVKGSLKRVADTGFKEIESAFSKKGGYYGMKPKEFAAMVKDLGMQWKSHHVLGAPFKLPPGAKMPLGSDGKPLSIPVMNNLRDNMQQLVDEAAEGGVEFLVCANTPISTGNDVKSSIVVLQKTGEACKKAGIGFAYHNHDAEFKTVDGIVPYDLILTQTDPSLVKMELDLAWAIKAGKDPVEIFRANPGRFPLWHVKDLDATHENVMPVGTGTIDFKRIFEAGSTAGVRHYFVEHDMPKDPWSSISTSINYLKKMSVA